MSNYSPFVSYDRARNTECAHKRVLEQPQGAEEWSDSGTWSSPTRRRLALTRLRQGAPCLSSLRVDFLQKIVHNELAAGGRIFAHIELQEFRNRAEL